MIYGTINQVGATNFNGLLFQKKIGWENSFFSQKHLPNLTIWWLKGTGNLKCSFFIDHITNWSIFVFGEIYNYEEVFKNYPTTSSETNAQSIMRLLLQNGVHFAENLNGDFIILLSNSKENTTYVVRDHLGIFPFSYTVQDNVIYYCSDALSLCRAFYPDEPINPEFLLRDFKITDNSLTPNKNVKRLLPGHYLLIKNNVAKQHKYWFPEKILTDNSYTAERVFKEATALIEDAVKIRVDKKLKAASHISGGLDSSTIAVLSKKHYSHQKKFFGFSWSPDYNLFPHQGERDERILVEKICKKNQIEPVFSSYSTNHFQNFYDNPLNYSLYSDEQLFQEFAKKNEIHLIFSGYGGDQFISCGTYGIFIDLLRSFKWRKYWKVARTWSPMTILKSIVLDFLFPVMGFLPLNFFIQNRDSTQFIKKPFKKNHKPSLRHFILHKSRKEMHLGMLYSYHIPLRTEEWYNWGTKYGVQYRYPLLDKRIVEFMLKIPSDYLYQGSFGRVLLREAAKEILPEDIRWSTSKTDPALFKYVDELVNDFFLKYNPQLEDFKKNSALDFFDFKKFETAISKEKRKSPSIQSKSIISTFIQLKYLHEFTKQYAE